MNVYRSTVPLLLLMKERNDVERVAGMDRTYQGWDPSFSHALQRDYSASNRIGVRVAGFMSSCICSFFRKEVTYSGEWEFVVWRFGVWGEELCCSRFVNRCFEAGAMRKRPVEKQHKHTGASPEWLQASKNEYLLFMDDLSRKSQGGQLLWVRK